MLSNEFLCKYSYREERGNVAGGAGREYVFGSKRSAGRAGGLLEKAVPADKKAPPAPSRQLLLLKPLTLKLFIQYLRTSVQVARCAFICHFLSSLAL